MSYSLARGLFWGLTLAILAALPLAIAQAGAVPTPRSFAVELGVALGFVGLGLLALQFLCSGRIKKVAPSFGMDNIIQYHREMGVVGFLLILGHVVVLVGASMWTVVHTRVVRPWLSRKRPYRVLGVEPERDASWSLTLEPEGHPGMRFRPGQFAWITLNDSPSTLQQHPFTFASSARSRRIRFTAKELGDFTSTWKDIEPGGASTLNSRTSNSEHQGR